MVPSWSSYPHGPPLLRRVRTASPFPDFTAPIRSSDSLVPVGRGSGCPSPAAYLDRVLLLVCRRVHPANASSSEIGHRVPVPRMSFEERLGLPGYGAVPMSRVPRSYTPPDTIPSSPIDGQDRYRLRAYLRTRHPEYHQFRGRIPPGPRACAPTHQRLRYRRRCKAYRYRLGWAHPWPDGISTRWTTCWKFTKSSHSSLLSKPHSLDATGRMICIPTGGRIQEPPPSVLSARSRPCGASCSSFAWLHLGGLGA